MELTQEMVEVFARGGQVTIEDFTDQTGTCGEIADIVLAGNRLTGHYSQRADYDDARGWRMGVEDMTFDINLTRCVIKREGDLLMLSSGYENKSYVFRLPGRARFDFAGLRTSLART